MAMNRYLRRPASDPPVKDDLLVVVPSRGRPGNIARLAEAFARTCRGDTTLLVGLDGDDPALPGYLELGFPEVQMEIADGLHFVVPWINHLAVPRANEYRFIGTIGDDNLPQTEGWDLRVIETLTELGTGFCFGDDKYPGRVPGSLCCHVFMTSDVIRSLGYMGPPSIQHMYVDPVWFAWGQAIGIRYLPDVNLEHLHYSCGKSAGDASYYASSALIPSDCDRYNEYCRDGLNADIERIRAGTQPFSPEELARFNHDLNIPRRWGEPA